jgi:Xaa-Pro aminopeptidase
LVQEEEMNIHINQSTANPIIDAERSVSEEECRQRTEKVKAFARKNGLAAVVSYSMNRYAVWNQTGHVGYITRWSNLDRTADTAVVIPVEGDPILLYCGLPTLVPCITRVSWLKKEDIWQVSSPDPAAVTVNFTKVGANSEPENSYGKLIEKVLNMRGLKGQAVGLINSINVPHGVYLSMKRVLGDSLREDVPDIIAQLRAVKSPAEIALHRKAAEINDIGYEALFKEIKVGGWGHVAVGKAIAAMRAEGADYAHFSARSNPADSYFNILDQRPNDRRYDNHDQIEAGAFVVYGGYWVQSLRSGGIGSISKSTEVFAQVVSDMVDACVSVTKVGLPAKGTVEAADAVAQKAGFQMPVRRVGHGQGLDYSDSPFVAETSDDIFQVGNIIQYHPNLTDPTSGIVRLPLGECFVLTENGPEQLTHFQREPFLIS